METATTLNTISVELTGPRQCSDLVEFLESRGLTASLQETDDHCELTVSFAPSPETALRTAVHNALIAWLAREGSPLVLAEDGDDTYVLRPPSD
jgi:hypothetical protein